MGNNSFEELAKCCVMDWYTENEKDANKRPYMAEIFIVWVCKILQNNKALVSTSKGDGMYFEITYNGDKKEMYVDAYKKLTNKCISRS